MNDNSNQNIDNLWKYEDSKSLLLSWYKLPFNTKTSIRWRGILIHIRINAYRTDTGWSRIITFLYKDKLYHCGLTKWKWMGGGNGVYPPEISTSSHKLKIDSASGYLSLKDQMITTNGSEVKDEYPFEIMKTPEDIMFDAPKPEMRLESVKLKIEKNQVTLYESHGSNTDINSYAYFEAENLIRDYWKLGNNYEDEYSITVLRKNLLFLFIEFDIEIDNNAQLLIAISNAFRGENGFEKFKKYLILKRIPF